MNLKEIKVLEVEPELIENFKCRDEKVKRYLIEESRKREEMNLTRTTVFIEETTGEVIGYYAMHAAYTKLAKYIRRGTEREIEEWGPVMYTDQDVDYPSIKLHFFGRCDNDLYKGIGSQFLMHFLNKCYQLTKVIGFSLIALECKTDLKQYYKDHGFKCIGSDGERKVMAMKSTDLKELFE